MRRVLTGVVMGLAVAAGWWSWCPPKATVGPQVAPPPAEAGRSVGATRPAPAPRPRPIAAAPAPETSEGVPTPSVVHEALRSAFAGRFPDRSVSEADLERMTKAVMRARAARAAMRRLRYVPEEGGELRRLRDELGEAVADFERVAGMSMAELTRQVQGGLTESEPEGAVDLRPLEPPEGPASPEPSR